MSGHLDPRRMAPTGTVLDIDPGEGNLNLKAYIAGVVGPKRVAFSAKQVKTLLEANSTKLINNNPQSGQVAFVSVSLVGPSAAATPALFDSQQDVGQNSIPSFLSGTLGAASGISFEAVLLPGDDLFGRAGIGAGTFNVVVSTSWF